MTDIWSNLTTLETLEFDRQERRKIRKHLTWDCFNAHADGDRVRCIKNHRLRLGNETMSLASVLRGITPSTCWGCPDFEGETNEKETESPAGK